MHIDEIRTDLRRRDTAAAELAFRALVTGDDIIEGVSHGATQAAETLEALARLLVGDARPLPTDVADRIARGTTGIRRVDTYGEAAKTVLAELPRWQALLAERYPEAIEGE